MMKKFLTIALFTLITGAAATVEAQKKTETTKNELPTVASVDLKRYAGKWFEIARYPNKFQKQCVGNTTATYTLKENGKIAVLNQCLKKNGLVDKAKGEARVADKTTNAKLEVRFAPKFLSFIPAVWGDYWIVYLDDAYENVAVGDPKREYFWILSRKPEMSDRLYQQILRKAETLGFNPARVEKTPQNVESLPGAAIEKPQ